MPPEYSKTEPYINNKNKNKNKKSPVCKLGKARLNSS